MTDRYTEISTNTNLPTSKSMAALSSFPRVQTRFNTHYQNAYANAFLELLRFIIASTRREEGLVTAQLHCAVWPVEQRCSVQFNFIDPLKRKFVSFTSPQKIKCWTVWEKQIRDRGPMSSSFTLYKDFIDYEGYLKSCTGWNIKKITKILNVIMWVIFSPSMLKLIWLIVEQANGLLFSKIYNLCRLSFCISVVQGVQIAKQKSCGNLCTKCLLINTIEKLNTTKLVFKFKIIHLTSRMITFHWKEASVFLNLVVFTGCQFFLDWNGQSAVNIIWKK